MTSEEMRSNPREGWVNVNDSPKERYNICKSCDRLNKLTKICKECGCFMPAKTKLKGKLCPLNKWSNCDNNLRPMRRNLQGVV